MGKEIPAYCILRRERPIDIEFQRILGQVMPYIRNLGQFMRYLVSFIW